MKIFGDCKICNKKKELKKYKYYDPMCIDCARNLGLTQKHHLVSQELTSLKFDDEKPIENPKTPPKRERLTRKTERKIEELITENAKLEKKMLELEDQLDFTTKQLFHARNNSALKDKMVEKLKAEVSDLEHQVERLEKTVEIYKKGEKKCQKK